MWTQNTKVQQRPTLAGKLPGRREFPHGRPWQKKTEVNHRSSDCHNLITGSYIDGFRRSACESTVSINDCITPEGQYQLVHQWLHNSLRAIELTERLPSQWTPQANCFCLNHRRVAIANPTVIHLNRCNKNHSDLFIIRNQNFSKLIQASPPLDRWGHS